MDKKRIKNIYLKSTTFILSVFVLFLPILNAKALTNAYDVNTNPFSNKNNAFSSNDFSFNAQNASLVFDSIIGCTITTESISNTISKVMTKGEKFGSKVNSRFQEIFNSNKDDTVDLNMDEDDYALEKYYWKAGSDADITGGISKFSSGTSITLGEPVMDLSVISNTKQALKEQEELNKTAELELKEAELERVREQCLNGVAYALAKRQLAKITNDTISWVNTGLGGDPLFVRDQASYLQNIADQKLFEFLSPISSSGNSSIYPYGRDFARSALQNRSITFEEKSQSTMSLYLPQNTTTKDWANDFSLGGWDSWFAYTQNEANNPLGYQLIATEELANRQNQAIVNAKDELNQGSGFISEKKCVEWIENEKYGKIIGQDTETGEDIVVEIDPEDANEEGYVNSYENKFFSTIENPYEKRQGYTCLRYETVTPGSVIENQVNNTLTSAVRQLELADSLNESLSVLFQGLLNNLMSKGLRNLDQNMFKIEQNQNSFSVSTLYDSLGNNVSLLPGYSNDRDILNVNRGSGVNTNDFDITIDLGDITGTIYYEGCQGLDGKYRSCIAQNNPLDRYLINKIVLDECSDGIDNDKDGVSDSKDPTCAIKNTGVVKKGLIRIQKEYIDAVKASKDELPKIMPALGELDYCIPGPNPSWREVIIDDVNYSIEVLRSLNINQDGEITSIYGNLEDLDRQYYSSQPGNKLRTAGQVLNTTAIITGSFFGPAGTAIGSGVGFLINNIFEIGAQNKEEKAYTNYNNARILKERYLAGKINDFEEQRRKGISRIIKTFTSYENDYEELYGPNSPMRTQSGIFGKNNFYLPMANAGLELTKSMHIYARNISKAEIDYNELIAETDANVYKLEEIKKKVDTIVLKARARRADEIRRGTLVIPAECKGLVDLGIDTSKSDTGRPSTLSTPTSSSTGSSGTGIKNNTVTNTKTTATQGTGVVTGGNTSGGSISSSTNKTTNSQ